MAEPVVGFDKKTAFKLSRMAKENAVEGLMTPPTPAFLREVDAGTVTATISARNGTTAGTGTVTSAYTNQTYSVENWFAQSIDSGTYVVVARVATTEWIVIAADCPT